MEKSVAPHSPSASQMHATCLSRREMLHGLLSTSAAVAAGCYVTRFQRSILAAESTLRQLAADKGLLYGCAAAQERLTVDQGFIQLVRQQCSLLVPEVALKWKYVEPQPNQFNFQLGDWMLNFARSNNMQFRGTPLVWDEAIPPWVEALTRQNALKSMLNHISKLAGHYAGQLQSWDVVNEALAYQGKDGVLKDTLFLRLIGPDYIDLAFHAAAEADPHALLVYNETHLEYDTPQDDYRRGALLSLLERLLSKKVPVGALGLQAHLRTGNVPFSAAKVQKFLGQVADMGLKILVTELDVSEVGPEALLADRDRAVAHQIEQFLGAVLQEKAVTAVITWGLSSRYTWIASHAPRADGQAVRPLPYDSDLRPTAAWQALASVFAKAPRR